MVTVRYDIAYGAYCLVLLVILAGVCAYNLYLTRRIRKDILANLVVIRATLNDISKPATEQLQKELKSIWKTPGIPKHMRPPAIG